MYDSVRPHRQQPTRLPHPWDSPGKNTGAGCHFLLQCMKVKSERDVAQSYLTLSDPMVCSLPGSSVHRIFQTRVLKWGAIALSVSCASSLKSFTIGFSSREPKTPDVQAGFRKGRGTRDQIANIRWIIKKARKFHKNIYFYFINYAQAFDCVDHNKLENSSRYGNTRPPDLPPEKSVCRSRSTGLVRTGHGTTDWCTLRLYIITLLI